MPPYLANGLVTPRKILDLRSGAGGSVCTAKNQSIDISVILVQRDYCQSDRSPPFHVDFMPRGRLPRPWWRHQMETFSALLAICAGNSPHKGQWRGALMLSLICTRINGWVNTGEAGDLRRHRAHYDVTVMSLAPLVRGMHLPSNL